MMKKLQEKANLVGIKLVDFIKADFSSRSKNGWVKVNGKSIRINKEELIFIEGMKTGLEMTQPQPVESNEEIERLQAELNEYKEAYEFVKETKQKWVNKVDKLHDELGEWIQEATRRQREINRLSEQILELQAKGTLTLTDKEHALLKQARKMLAMKYHTDKGGNHDDMVRINNLFDRLLGAEIKAELAGFIEGTTQQPKKEQPKPKKKASEAGQHHCKGYTDNFKPTFGEAQCKKCGATFTKMSWNSTKCPKCAKKRNKNKFQ